MTMGIATFGTYESVFYERLSLSGRVLYQRSPLYNAFNSLMGMNVGMS